MIYLELLMGFLQVSCFAFGGAYGAIPIIRDIVLSYGWLSDEAIAYMIAVSESTPGPIMINLATYVGSSQAGIIGSFLATLAVVLPSFVIILLLTSVMNTALKNKYIQAALRGMKPCIIGIILATGTYMTITGFLTVSNSVLLDFKAAAITVLLFASSAAYKRARHKKLSPISLISISALLGLVFYGL